MGIKILIVLGIALVAAIISITVSGSARQMTLDSTTDKAGE